jgi:hypothetical protein
MTIADAKGPELPEVAAAPRSRALVPALLVVILVLAAFLVTGLTLPLLGRSNVAFFAVAGVCWAGIFAGAFFVSRSLGRTGPKSD